MGCCKNIQYYFPSSCHLPFLLLLLLVLHRPVESCHCHKVAKSEGAAMSWDELVASRHTEAQ